MSKRFPWNTVKGWSVSSRADGTLLVEPHYDPEVIKPYTPEDGGGPGLFTRMRLADWVLNRLCKQQSPRNSRAES